MDADDRCNFDMLKEVRDAHKHVTDAAEFIKVINKLCKAQLSLEQIKMTYAQAEALD